MLAVKLTPSGEVQVVEIPRPQIEKPTDAILMVTTAAIGPWEIAAVRSSGAFSVPGTQFVGIVVETGEAVTQVNIDDLVVATSTGLLRSGKRGRFGRGSLAGGHAEYVRIPDADNTLVKTTPSAEERSVFAGGELAMGINAAEKALAAAGDGPILTVSCDASVLSAIAWIRHRRGRTETIFANDSHPARLAAAKALGAKEISYEEVKGSSFNAAILGGRVLAFALTPHKFPVTPGDIGSDGTVAWPTLEDTRRAEMAVRLRQVDLTPLVSTVLPLDEAAEAYRIAVEQPPGTRSVLLKP